MSAFERFVMAENAEEMEEAVKGETMGSLVDSAFEDIKKMLGELCSGISQMAEYVKGNAYHRQLINIGDVRLNITLDADGERLAELNIRPNDGMRVVLVPRHVDGEARFPLSFPTMAKAAAYLDVPPHDVRAAFVRGCMVASRKDGRSWFVVATDAEKEDGDGQEA